MLFLGVVLQHGGYGWLQSGIVCQVADSMLIQLNGQCWSETFTFSMFQSQQITGHLTIGEYLLPTKPGIIPFWRKFTVAPPLQNTFCDKFREPLKLTTGPLPAPTSISSHPLFTRRRPVMTKPPCPVPLWEARFPDMTTVSRVVIGASIDWDIDMPDTSIVGNPRPL